MSTHETPHEAPREAGASSRPPAGSGRARSTVDPREVDHFDRLAAEWWDPAGPMRPLHRINPLRLAFIRDAVCRQFGRDATAPFPFAGLSVLDVGCGAGLLSEPAARLGAAVTGLDPAPGNVGVARAHAAEGGLAIDYRTDAVETVAAAGERFDVVLAMEVVEHVTDMDAFVAAAGAAVRPGGLLLMATLNRTLRSFALAIVGAEYVLRWLPRGTHDWEKFVTPGELGAAVRRAGLGEVRLTGMVFSPLRNAWSLSDDTAVNYLLSAARAPAGPNSGGPNSAEPAGPGRAGPGPAGPP